ncbi:MAG: hypothetical protein JSU97_04115 [Dehalococcoidia bacterium]|nr:MAG: hypothetical protein JSU97_04115 [Dehalococcoidia bacterium]
MREKMTRATVLVTVVLLALALALGVRWALNTTSAAAPTGNLTCSVKASCDAEEVEVFRMFSTTNAHAGTPAGSGYGWSVCCGEVCHLSTDCSDVNDTVVTLSADDNAHVAADGSYGTQVCLSVPYGVADCTHGPSCAEGYECVATVSGDNNAHVADCDGTDDYGTKVCCRVVNDCDNDTILDPDDPDDDGDEFNDDVEGYLPTDSCDDCPDATGTPGLCPGPTCDGHDAWPLDNNVDKNVTVVGDVLNYAGNIGVPVGGDPLLQRLDLNADGSITTVGDVLPFAGNIGAGCT